MSEKHKNIVTDPNVKHLMDVDKCPEDDDYQTIDSGFLSGENITSSSDLSSQPNNSERIDDASDQNGGNNHKHGSDYQTIDSGFISGLIEEESDEQNGGNYNGSDSSNSLNPDKQVVDQNNSMRCDSGVVLGLTETFSDISLANGQELNDLSGSRSIPNSCAAELKNRSHTLPPTETVHSVDCELYKNWELYFEQDTDGDT